MAQCRSVLGFLRCSYTFIAFTMRSVHCILRCACLLRCWVEFVAIVALFVLYDTSANTIKTIQMMRTSEMKTIGSIQGKTLSGHIRNDSLRDSYNIRDTVCFRCIVLRQKILHIQLFQKSSRMCNNYLSSSTRKYQENIKYTYFINLVLIRESI